MAKLFVEGGPSSGEKAEARPSRTGIEASAGDGRSVRILWERATVKLAGFDDAYVAWSGPDELSGAPVQIWTERSFLKELGSYQTSLPASLRRQLDGMMNRRTALKSAGLAVALFALLCVGGLLYFVFGGPLTSVVLALLPSSVDESLGEMMAEEAVEGVSVCEDPELQEALNRMVASLSDAAGEHPYTFVVTVLRSPELNATAAPGGGIYVHSGLLEASSDPSELAAVLGHEVQHVLGRHTLRRVVRLAGLGIVATVLVGDAGEVAGTLAKSAGFLGALTFGRDDEREADEMGMQLLVGGGFDPHGAARMFTLIQVEGDEELPIYLRSHPFTQERIDRARTWAADVPVPAAPTLHELDWASLRGRCASTEGS